MKHIIIVRANPPQDGGYRAFLKNNEKKFGQGLSFAEAIGNLIEKYPDELDIGIVHIEPTQKPDGLTQG